MNNLWINLIIIATIVLSSCNTPADNPANAESAKTESTQPFQTIKVKHQYITGTDGTVEEKTVDATVEYNDSEIRINFANSEDKNLILKVEKIDKKDKTGITFLVKDRVYESVFITSGQQPQINLSPKAGYGATTLM